MVLPHFDEVLRAQDERADAPFVLNQTSECRCHQGFAQTYHVANKNAAALVEMMSSNPHSCTLKFKKLAAKFQGDAKFSQPGPRLLRQVVGHLDVNVVRRHEGFTSPAFFDDLCKFRGNVDAPAIFPAVLEPLGQLVASVVIEHVNIQLTLAGQTSEGQIAAAKVANSGIDGIWSEKQVELGVERMAKKELDDYLLLLDLASQSSQASFVFVRGCANGQLLAEILCQSFL